MTSKYAMAIMAGLVIFSPNFANASDLLDGLNDPAPQGTAVNWSGVYLGVHGGWAHGGWEGDLQYQGLNAGYSESQELDVEDWHYGGQVGVNRQVGSFVFGLEADATFGEFDQTGTFVTDAETDFDSSTDDGNYAKKLDLDIDWFGTARVRAGYAVGQFLPYVTGGIAFAKTSGNLEVTYPNGNPDLASIASANENHLGWTIGAGLEADLGAGWSLKGEYLYLDLGEVEHPFQGEVYNGSPFGTDSFEADLKLNVWRAGLNYRF